MEAWAHPLLTAAAAFLLVAATLPLALRLLYRGGMVATNFRGDAIPVGYGAALALFGALGAFDLGAPALGAAVLGFALLGFVDDRFGDRSTGGLGGHFRELFHGHVTSGAVKAVGGAVLALAIGRFVGGGPLLVLLDALLIALWANAVNLLDLRPGRSLKAFLPLGACAVFVPGGSALLPLWAGALAGWRTDLRARAMLGDTGSNALGAALGAAALGLGVDARVVLVIVLILFHLYTERHSVSVLIEHRPALLLLDRWGRS